MIAWSRVGDLGRTRLLIRKAKTVFIHVQENHVIRQAAAVKQHEQICVPIIVMFHLENEVILWKTWIWGISLTFSHRHEDAHQDRTREFLLSALQCSSLAVKVTSCNPNRRWQLRYTNGYKIPLILATGQQRRMQGALSVQVTKKNW